MTEEIPIAHLRSILHRPESADVIMEVLGSNPLLIAALKATENPDVIAAMLRNEMLLRTIELTGLPDFVPNEVTEGLLRNARVLEELRRTIDPDILAAMSDNPALAGIELRRKFSDLGMADFEDEETPGGKKIIEGGFKGGASDDVVDKYLEEQNLRFLKIATAIIDNPELRTRVLNLNNYQLGLIEEIKETELELARARSEATNLRRDLSNRNDDFTRISTREENARRTAATICEEFDGEKKRTRFWKRATTALTVTFGLFIGGAFLLKEWRNKPEIEIVNRQDIYKQSSEEKVLIRKGRYEETISMRLIMDGPESGRLLLKLELPGGAEARTFINISIDTHLNRFSFKTDRGIINRNFEPMGIPYPEYLAKVIGYELARKDFDFPNSFPGLYEAVGIPQRQEFYLAPSKHDNDYERLVLEELIYKDLKRGLKSNSFLPQLRLVSLGKSIVDICQTEEDKGKVREHFIKITDLITKKESEYLKIAYELEKIAKVLHKAVEELEKEDPKSYKPLISRGTSTSDADGFFIEGTLPRGMHEDEVQNTGQKYLVSEEQLRAKLGNNETIKVELSGFIRVYKDLALGREIAPLSR